MSTLEAVRLRDLGERALIARIARAARGAPARAVLLGIGDDAALLRPAAGEDLVVSTDARVEDVHFRWATDPPRVLGRTALAAALSDLAAMGARPLGFTCALAAPGALPLARFEGMLGGLLHEARRHRCPLVGGNLTRARETSLVLTVLGGALPGRALRRHARAGDRVLVTGALGAAALARARAERRGTPLRHVPVPRLAQGRRLARLASVRGCIDVSDGLDADLGQLLGAGLRCRVEPRALPLPRGFAAGCRALGLDPEALARRGGDDYELLFALAPGGPSAAALARRLRVRVSELGRVERAPAGRGGRPESGFRHFARGTRRCG